VKTEDEVAMYRAIGEQYAHAMRAFREAIRPGVSEHKIASTVAEAWYGVGGEDIAELEVCSGGRINPWQRWPTWRTVHAGEFVAIDFHARGYGGLIGDLSRTYLSGSHPSAEQRDLYQRAVDYLLATTETLRAGRSVGEVLDLLPKVPEKYEAQLYNYNIAHSIGMVWAGIPEVNKIKRRAEVILQPNNVLTVESYFAETGSLLGAKLERMVVVREGEPEVLDSEIPLDDWLIS
jgi:Xaa-Pro aminopeptidase